MLATSEPAHIPHPVQGNSWGAFSTSFSRPPAAPDWPSLRKFTDLKHTQTIHFYIHGVTNRLLQGNRETHCPVSLYNTELNWWRSGSPATHLKGQSKYFLFWKQLRNLLFWRNRDLNKTFSSFPHPPPISSTMNVASFHFFPIALCAKFYQHLFHRAINICSHVFLPE